LEKDEIYFNDIFKNAIEKGMKIRTIIRIRSNGIYTAKLRKLPYCKGKIIEILENLSEDIEEDEEKDTKY
jgi:hypothetical protein